MEPLVYNLALSLDSVNVLKNSIVPCFGVSFTFPKKFGRRHIFLPLGEEYFFQIVLVFLICMDPC